VLKKSTRLRCDTCAIASPRRRADLADETRDLVALEQPLRLGGRRLRVHAVLGDQLDLAPHHAAGSVDLVDRKRDAHHRVFTQRPEEAGARRQMSEANGIGLSADDRGKAQCGKRCGSARSPSTNRDDDG
jgi:hypothetical protein